MGPEKKKKKSARKVVEEGTSQQAIAELGKVIVENLEQVEKESLEVFDLYTLLLRQKIHARNDNFCDRLIKGYVVLTQALTQH